MLVLPTSASSAIILEQSQGSPLWALFGYVTIAMLFGCGYCVWEMVLASLLERRPGRARWVMLVVSAALFCVGILVDSVISGGVVFNGKLETTWGFVLSPWFFIAFIPCAAVLVVLRLLDSRKAGPFLRMPGVVWWLVGLTTVVAFGVVALWSGGRGAALEAAVTVGGVALALASVVSLGVVSFVRRGRREATA